MAALIGTNIAVVLVCVAAAAIDRLPTDDEGFLRRGAIEVEAAGLDGRRHSTNRRIQRGTAMENLVRMESLAEAAEVVRDGAQFIFSEATGKVESVPFSQLDRQGQMELLAYGVDWTEYVNCGMEPIECDRIVMNAVDGKPQERWLEPIANEEQWIAEHRATMHEEMDKIRTSVAERESRSSPTFAQLLESFASPEPACVEINHARER
jgi:hypothetical protein